MLNLQSRTSFLDEAALASSVPLAGGEHGAPTASSSSSSGLPGPPAAHIPVMTFDDLSFTPDAPGRKCMLDFLLRYPAKFEDVFHATLLLGPPTKEYVKLGKKFDIEVIQDERATSA